MALIISSIQCTDVVFALLGNFQNMIIIPQILTLNVKSPALRFPEEKSHFTLICNMREILNFTLKWTKKQAYYWKVGFVSWGKLPTS